MSKGVGAGSSSVDVCLRMKGAAHPAGGGTQSPPRDWAEPPSGPCFPGRRILERRPGLNLAVVVFSGSVVSNPATPWTAARQSFTISRSWLRLMSIESMMPSNYLILCCPLLLLPAILPNIRVWK